ncbi:MAG: DUF6572 domain-containing protein [Chthoniobacteraceae bacterium]
MPTDPTTFPLPGERRGVEHAEVIDLLTHDAASGQVELVMFEPRAWDGGEEQLFQLQEKMNAYLGFALDGEMAEAHPELAGKPLRVVLRCTDAPPADAVEFLAHVREQIALQGIDLEVRYQHEGGCGCH